MVTTYSLCRHELRRFPTFVWMKIHFIRFHHNHKRIKNMRNGKEKRKKSSKCSQQQSKNQSICLPTSSTVPFSLAVLHIITYKTPDATQKYLAFPVALTTLPKIENVEILESGFIPQCAKRQRIQMPPPQIAC